MSDSFEDPQKAMADQGNQDEKKKHWEEEKKEVDRIVDGIGERVDEGIKEAIIALSLLGINTAASCEGHLDHGTGAPFIDIESKLAGALEEKMEKASSEEESDKIFQELQMVNLEEGKKVLDLLEEFYQDRKVPYYQRIIVVLFGSCLSRLESQGTGMQKIQPEDIKKQRLVEFQEEMKKFSEFLKEKFFAKTK
jgi:hypothetical protein